VLFSGLQIRTEPKQFNKKAKGTEYLKESEKDGVIKEVINSFDQLALLNEVEKLVNDSDKDCRQKRKELQEQLKKDLPFLMTEIK
jgi:hypothetical protein